MRQGFLFPARNTYGSPLSVPAPNPHTFPLVAYPGLAPELDIRSGMGGWEPYALEAPTDRLLPFVLARRKNFRNAKWISCIRIEHADTAALIVALYPTGAKAPPNNMVPSLGVVFTKQTDGDAEYFTYDGALVPGLDAALPCGVPLRLVVDNIYQSPRFLAIRPASALNLTHLLLEWYHTGPLQGVPYGRGFRQRLYIDNGSNQYLDNRTVEETTKNPNGGPDRIDNHEEYAQRQFTVAPVPVYLSQALANARSVKYFLSDGEAWRLITVKSSPSGEGGRWVMTGTIEDENPILTRGCDRPVLDLTAYDPVANIPRAWRCGDTSDTASEYVGTGALSCEIDPSTGINTGYVIEVTQDVNPNSPSYNQTSTQLSTSQDFTRCPLRPAGARVGVNKTVQDAQVLVDISRTDGLGDLVVNLEVQAEVTSGGNPSTQTFTGSYTIPAGSTQLLNQTLSYGGALLVNFHYLRIVSIAPAVYYFDPSNSY